MLFVIALNVVIVIICDELYMMDFQCKQSRKRSYLECSFLALDVNPAGATRHVNMLYIPCLVFKDCQINDSINQSKSNN